MKEVLAMIWVFERRMLAMMWVFERRMLAMVWVFERRMLAMVWVFERRMLAMMWVQLTIIICREQDRIEGFIPSSVNHKVVQIGTLRGLGHLCRMQ